MADGVGEAMSSPQAQRWLPRAGEHYFVMLGNGTIARFPWNDTPFDHEGGTSATASTPMHKPNTPASSSKRYSARCTRHILNHALESPCSALCSQALPLSVLLASTDVSPAWVSLSHVALIPWHEDDAQCGVECRIMGHERASVEGK